MLLKLCQLPFFKTNLVGLPKVVPLINKIKNAPPPKAGR
jgi:hypothetical protein